VPTGTSDEHECIGHVVRGSGQGRCDMERVDTIVVVVELLDEMCGNSTELDS
jgi:hypothetical protein